MCFRFLAGFNGSYYATSRGAFGIGPSTQPIFLDQVNCYGTETSLFQCSHNPIGIHDCSHFEDAGVTCECKD